MKTPEEILNEVAAENMINIQQMVTTKQLSIIAMRRYAKLYHQSKVKNLDIQRVSQQRKLLIDYGVWIHNLAGKQNKVLAIELADEYLKAINCG